MRMSWLASLLVLVLGASCASYPGEELAPLDPSELEGQTRLPPVTFELKTYISAWMGTAGDPRARAEPLFRRAFSEVREVNASNAEEGELHLDLLLRQTPRNPGVTLGLGILWACSLGLIPAYGRNDLYLDARVVRGGETLQSYVYRDHVSTWSSIVLLPWSFTRDPENVHAEVLDSMLLHLLRDLRRDLPGLAARAGG